MMKEKRALRSGTPEKKDTVFDSDEHWLFAVLNEEHHPTVQRWLDRGDGVAVYRNMALDASNLGHRKFVSFGSPAAQLEVDEPPKRLPDIGGQINWPYQLERAIRREETS